MSSPLSSHSPVPHFASLKELGSSDRSLERLSEGPEDGRARENRPLRKIYDVSKPSDLKKGGRDGRTISEEILGKLRFLSKISPGEKIDVATLEAYPSTFWSNLHRRYASSETKEGTFAFVSDTINLALDIVDESLKSDDELIRSIAQLLINEITGARKGIEALIQTYSPIKRSYVSDLEIMLDMIDLKLSLLVRRSQLNEPA